MLEPLYKPSFLEYLVFKILVILYPSAVKYCGGNTQASLLSSLQVNWYFCLAFLRILSSFLKSGVFETISQIDFCLVLRVFFQYINSHRCLFNEIFLIITLNFFWSITFMSLWILVKFTIYQMIILLWGCIHFFFSPITSFTSSPQHAYMSL